MSETVTETTTPSEVVDSTSTDEPIVNDSTSTTVEPENSTEAVETATETEQELTTQEEKLILGKYKTVEDAEAGLRNKESYIDKRETEAICS